MRPRIGRTPWVAARAAGATVLALALLALGYSQAGSDTPKPAKTATKKAGPSVNDPRAYQGYTLLAPMMSTNTYLLDMQGRVVRTWKSDCTPALSAYLLANGHLLRPGTVGRGGPGGPGGPGTGGRIQEFTWDGAIVWDFKFGNEKQGPHHDICKLPNGNVLLIAWDKKSAKEAVAAGRVPESLGNRPLQADSVIEVRPTGKTSGEVVWQWHVWDHLIQDRDKSKANFGDVAAHPERIDVNFGEGLLAPLLARKDGLDKLRSIGYLGGGTKKQGRVNPDWTHINSVAYNADLDQILLSVHSFSEIWVIDHGTTTAEAAGHSGGRYGKGGDLLYRWGNPRAYRGKGVARRLFAQHNAHWIAKGLPGEGHILIFNNGGRRPTGSYSSVDEIVLPVDARGRYTRKPAAPYGPAKAAWSYTAPKKSDFYAMFISGAQRLPNGDTLVCSGPAGSLFEVTTKGEVVWKYTNPVRGGPGGPGGFPRFGGPPQPGQILPSFLQDLLKLTAAQKKQLAALQKEVDGKLQSILTAAQSKQLKAGPMGFGPGGPPRFGGGRPGGPGGGSLFRAVRYGPDYPGLAGRDLTPGRPLEELQREAAKRKGPG